MRQGAFYDKIITKEKGDFMRKSLFLTLVLSLCMADFGAFAATRRGTVAVAQETQTAPVAARAAMRNTAPKTSAVSSPVQLHRKLLLRHQRQCKQEGQQRCLLHL